MTRLLAILALCLAPLLAHGALGNPGHLAMLKGAAGGGGSAPATPGSFVISSVDATGVTLGWANVANETGYWVERNDEASPGWEPWPGVDESDVNPTAANVTSYFAGTPQSVLGTQAGLCGIQWRVRSTNNFGGSAFTSPLQTPPSMVISDLAAQADDGAPAATSISLGWSATAEEGGSCKQNIYRSINGAGYTLWRADVNPFTSSDSDMDAAALDAFNAGQAVLYKLRSINASPTPGPYSNVATATPP